GIEVGSALAKIDHLEAAYRDIGFVAVLLPEQPLVHLRLSEAIRGDQRTAARERADDGIGLRERAAVIEFDGRHLRRAVKGEELRRMRLALERVDRHPRIGQREMVADPFDLQAIAGIAVAVDLHAWRFPLTKADEQAAPRLSTKPGAAARRDQNR